jgi:hypothetical protein
MPYTDIVDPTLTKPRNERVLPKCAKSNTANDAPSLGIPYIDKVDPSRKYDRNDKVAPK